MWEYMYENVYDYIHDYIRDYIYEYIHEYKYIICIYKYSGYKFSRASSQSLPDWLSYSRFSLVIFTCEKDVQFSQRLSHYD